MQATARHHLVQINVARLLYPLDHAGIAGFVSQLERVRHKATGAGTTMPEATIRCLAPDLRCP